LLLTKDSYSAGLYLTDQASLKLAHLQSITQLTSSPLLLNMLNLPGSRRWLFPALLLLIFVLFYRSIIRVPDSVKTIVRFRRYPQVQYGIKIPQEIIDEHGIPHRDPSLGHIWPEPKYYYKYQTPPEGQSNPYFEPLLHCHRKPNPHTDHIRLPNIVQTVSQRTSPDEAINEQKFNPTIIALPPWSDHQYLLVSRVVTEGFHQESLVCEADTCYSGNVGEGRRPGEKNCTLEEFEILGAAGGLRCATPAKTISIPPTPAERCEGSWASFPDIPGFHDPRIFWSGKGEPLIMVNSASRYGCVGLWITDLRTLHEPLKDLLLSQPGHPYHPGPLMSYPTLTELTRNPASTRASVEKNWFLFFPTSKEAFLHYDLSIPRPLEENKTGDGRTFAKLIGNGYTTPNLTDPSEPVCLHDEPDRRGKYGHWHQTSNSLKLILCHHAQAERRECSEDQEGRAVHFAVMHRKFSNEWNLPLRYERFFVVWDARSPFRMLGVSRHPVLMANETASGWSAQENWADDAETPGLDETPVAEALLNLTSGNQIVKEHDADDDSSPESNLTKSHSNTTTPPEKPNWAYFTYTPSIAWSFRPSPSLRLREHENHQPEKYPLSAVDADVDEEHTRTLEALNVGFLDDEVILGIGLDDQGQGFARVRAEELVGCLRACDA
jgi:hypothetical protein